MNSFYSAEELETLGLKSYGTNVLISRKASIYGAANISLGNNVRIDDFCILSGNITLGNYIHISAYTGLWGGSEGIVLEDYSCVSSRCAVYALSDDYSGETMTNSMVPEQYKNVTQAPVLIGKYAIVGSGCTVLPGVSVGEGASIGSMSLISKSLAPWGIYAGIPCKKIRDRKKDLLLLAQCLEDSDSIRNGD